MYHQPQTYNPELNTRTLQNLTRCHPPKVVTRIESQDLAQCWNKNRISFIQLFLSLYPLLVAFVNPFSIKFTALPLSKVLPLMNGQGEQAFESPINSRSSPRIIEARRPTVPGAKYSPSLDRMASTSLWNCIFNLTSSLNMS